MRNSKITSQMLQEILDMNLLHKFMNQIYMTVHIPITLCDMEGNVLVASNWSAFCKDYMRKDGRSSQQCISTCASETGEENGIFLCPYGLEMYKAPIKIREKTVAHIIVSQFLTEEPVEEALCKKAQKYGFDTGFRDSIRQIPVVSQKKLEEVIAFIDDFVILIHDMIERKMHVKALDEEVVQNYKELESAYQDISELNARLSVLNNDLRIKSNELSLREMRYRFLFTTMNQGILLLRKEAFPNKKGDYEYSVVDMNSAMQLMIHRLGQADGIPDKNLMKSDMIQHILSKICGEEEIIDFYFEKKTKRYYDIQSKMLNEHEIMICITDTTTTYEQLKNQKAQIWKLVVALGSLIEKRDLYTADHQRKVAILAAKIAIYMGLDKKKTEAIFMAGLLHDIGKIGIPFEILTKPDKLNEIEYEFMKTHVQITYDILKSINFTLPISEIAYQHHERLDGSGYPRGLKEKDIIDEAKILAVADVYEAITSHRPYRPSMGVEYEVRHLTENSGILYDANAVSSCIVAAQDNIWDINKIEEYLKCEGF